MSRVGGQQLQPHARLAVRGAGAVGAGAGAAAGSRCGQGGGRDGGRAANQGEVAWGEAFGRKYAGQAAEHLGGAPAGEALRRRIARHLAAVGD